MAEDLGNSGSQTPESSDFPNSKANQMVGGWLVAAGLSYSTAIQLQVGPVPSFRTWTITFAQKNTQNPINLLLFIRNSMLTAVVPFRRTKEERAETSLSALREWLNDIIAFVRIHGKSEIYQEDSFRTAMPLEGEYIGQAAVNASYGSVMQAVVALLDRFPGEFDFPPLPPEQKSLEQK